MEIINEFLANHYIWFILIAVFLTFALIGYIVDQKEQKDGLSQINRPKKKEMDISELASMAQNQSMNEAVTAAAKRTNSFPESSYSQNRNQITDTTDPNNKNNVGFDVLSK